MGNFLQFNVCSTSNGLDPLETYLAMTCSNCSTGDPFEDGNYLLYTKKVVTLEELVRITSNHKCSLRNLL